MVYVPILKTLEVLLNDEGILAEVSKSLLHIATCTYTKKCMWKPHTYVHACISICSSV